MNKVVLIKKEQSDLSNTPADHHCRVSDESEIYKAEDSTFLTQKRPPLFPSFLPDTIL